MTYQLDSRVLRETIRQSLAQDVAYITRRVAAGAGPMQAGLSVQLLGGDTIDVSILASPCFDGTPTPISEDDIAEMVSKVAGGQRLCKASIQVAPTVRVDITARKRPPNSVAPPCMPANDRGEIVRL